MELRTIKSNAKHTFKECCNSAEQLVNVAVGVTDWKEIKVNVLKNTAVDQRLQVRKQVPILVFPLK